MYVRMNEVIDAYFEEHNLNSMITDSKDFAKMHIESIGIGAILDTEFSCQSRLSNTISPSEFPINAEKSAKEMLKFMDGKCDAKLANPVVFMSLVPCVTESLTCTYKNSWFCMTRLEPNGTYLSIVFDGSPIWKRTDEMLQIVEKVAKQLGEGG